MPTRPLWLVPRLLAIPCALAALAAGCGEGASPTATPDFPATATAEAGRAQAAGTAIAQATATVVSGQTLRSVVQGTPVSPIELLSVLTTEEATCLQNTVGLDRLAELLGGGNEPSPREATQLSECAPRALEALAAAAMPEEFTEDQVACINEGLGEDVGPFFLRVFRGEVQKREHVLVVQECLGETPTGDEGVGAAGLADIQRYLETASQSVLECLEQALGDEALGAIRQGWRTLGLGELTALAGCASGAPSLNLGALSGPALTCAGAALGEAFEEIAAGRPPSLIEAAQIAGCVEGR